MKFSNKDIADYYNTTQIHYEQWWNLKKSLSLHYGIWEEGIQNFNQALVNTNRIMMNSSLIKEGDKVLDAGCGVGGAAFFLAQERKANVTGITLSEKQILLANAKREEKNLAALTNFQLMDYTKTDFDSETFDVVWACESFSSALDKSEFIKEAFRVLKKGGRLIISDYFLTDEKTNLPIISKWLKAWSISEIPSVDWMSNEMSDIGFSDIQQTNYSSQIKKSAKRMYWASILATVPSELYKITHLNKVSRFAKHHYKSGYYQYVALKQGLWQYTMYVGTKR